MELGIEKMNTYLAITPFFPSKTNFRGNYVFDQLNTIQQNHDYQVKVILIVSCYVTKKKRYTFHGIDCYPFRVWDLPSFILPGIFNSINNFRLSYFLKKNKINLSKGDIIHAHVTYPAAYLSKFLKKKYKLKAFVQHHGLDPFQLKLGRLSHLIEKVQNRFIIKRNRKVLSYHNLNIGVSEAVIYKLKSYFKKNKIKTTILYNGVDTKKFYPLIKASLNKAFTIGCVANFWKLKDQITLIKAVEILLEKGLKIDVKFVGTGKEKFNCISYVKKHKLQENFDFKDELKHTDLNLFYNQLDLFVLPSFNEALGCVYLESWAANTPFIGVKNQGIEELVPERLKHHMLINERDEKELAEKIEYFMNHKFLCPFNEELKIDNTIKKFMLEIEKLD